MKSSEDSYKITMFGKQGMTLSFIVTEEEKKKVDKYFKNKELQTTFKDAENNEVFLEDLEGELMGRVEENLGNYQTYKNKLANSQRGQIMNMPPIIR